MSYLDIAIKRVNSFDCKQEVKDVLIQELIMIGINTKKDLKLVIRDIPKLLDSIKSSLKNYKKLTSSINFWRNHSTLEGKKYISVVFKNGFEYKIYSPL